MNIKTWEKDGKFVASCPELEIYCFGQTKKHAIYRLKHVITFYASTAIELGYDIDHGEIQNFSKEIPSIQVSQFIN